MNIETIRRSGVAALAPALAGAGLAGCAAGGARTVAIRKTGDVGGLATWMQCSSQQGCSASTPAYPNVPQLPVFHVVPLAIPGCPLGGLYTFAVQVWAIQQWYGWAPDPQSTGGTWVPADQIHNPTYLPLVTRLSGIGEQCMQTTATIQIDPNGFVIDANEASVPQDLTGIVPTYAGDTEFRALVAETSMCGQTGQATWSATATLN